jgi:hypothetical protein
MFRALMPIAVVLSALLASERALAEVQCLEGRTATGACVDVSLGALMRESVRVFTQPRLSYSGPPVAPRDDRQYDVLRDWRQGLQREIYGPCTGARCP